MGCELRGLGRDPIEHPVTYSSFTILRSVFAIERDATISASPRDSDDDRLPPTSPANEPSSGNV